ncbi:hypothetical protein Pelo_13299 [Pelomyxa schiedti]|nr:hypothetical protein Pelo_13299 [Pelomyxa schiedti]
MRDNVSTAQLVAVVVEPLCLGSICNTTNGENVKDAWYGHTGDYANPSIFLLASTPPAQDIGVTSIPCTIMLLAAPLGRSRFTGAASKMYPQRRALTPGAAHA